MRDRQLYPSFLELDVAPPPAAQARFHILSAPYEKTVSYGTGTAQGPSAILRASLQLEAYDGCGVPAEAGIHTADPIDCGGAAEEALGRIAEAVRATVAGGHVPVLLGGEHTVTFGAIRALIPGAPFGVVQFDAHADLRESYEGTPYSHACVMRRVVEAGVPLFQLGVRSLTREEDDFRLLAGIGHLDAARLARAGVPAEVLPPGFPERIYLTFDVDALDPSIVPATGTPEPGGLQWYQTLDLLARIVAGRTVVGLDVVELAPRADSYVSDFAVARLLYNLLGLIVRGSDTRAT